MNFEEIILKVVWFLFFSFMVGLVTILVAYDIQLIFILSLYSFVMVEFRDSRSLYAIESSVIEIGTDFEDLTTWINSI